MVAIFSAVYTNIPAIFPKQNWVSRKNKYFTEISHIWYDQDQDMEGLKSFISHQAL